MLIHLRHRDNDLHLRIPVHRLWKLSKLQNPSQINHAPAIPIAPQNADRVISSDKLKLVYHPIPH